MARLAGVAAGRVQAAAIVEYRIVQVQQQRAQVREPGERHRRRVAMGEDTTTLVLLRFSGEIHLKARATRLQFVRRLVHNLQDALASVGLPPRVRASHDRLFVELPANAPVDPLVRVFGVQSASKIEARCSDDLAAIVHAGTANFAERVRG